MSLSELIFPGGASRRLKAGYAAIYSILAILATLYTLIFPYATFTWDTTGYIVASESIVRGELDLWRTPVYPLFIAFGRCLFSREFCFVGIEGLQWLIFILSVIPFRLACERVLTSKRAVFIAVLAYALNPGIFVYNEFILTESLSISGTAFFLASFLRGILEHRASSMFKTFIWLTLLIMLRPLFVCFVPIVLMAEVITNIGRKSTDEWRATVAGTLLLLVVCGSYIGVMYHKFHIKSFTIVNSLNDYYILRDKGLVTADNASTPIMAEVLRTHLSDTMPEFDDIWLEEIAILDKVGPAEFSRYISHTMSANPRKVCEVRLQRILKNVGDFPLSNCNKFSDRFDLASEQVIVSLRWAQIILIILGALYTVSFIRLRCFNLTDFILWGLPAILLFSSLFGAQGEYDRLFVPALGIFNLLCIYSVEKCINLIARR